MDGRWVLRGDAKTVKAGERIMRRALACSKDLMCVENTFERGTVGGLHHRPHTQITYVISGEFEFNIGGEKRIVKAGNAMFKMDRMEHNYICLGMGVPLDIFTPMHRDFV